MSALPAHRCPDSERPSAESAGPATLEQLEGRLLLSSAVLVIDNFESGNPNLRLTAEAPSSITVTETGLPTSDVIGGIRKTTVTKLTGGEGHTLAAFVIGGADQILALTTEAAATGVWLLEYGNDTDPLAYNPLGDITSGGLGDTLLTIFVDADHEIDVDVIIDDGGPAVTATRHKGAGAEALSFSLSEFAGVNLTQVEDLKVRFRAAVAGDYAISSIEVHNLVPNPGIDIEKATNGEDADLPTGPMVPAGDAVTWTYVVTNTGDVTLGSVVVTDDQGVVPVYQGGDTDGDGLLDVGEVWTYQAAGVAAAGQYANVSTVTGNPVQEDGTDIPGLDDVTDSDPSHYYGEQIVVEAGIDIEKYVKIVEQCKQEGLTPGFWKQCHHFGYWVGYSPWQKYEAVFGVNVPGCPTLLDALESGGGGIYALMRHSVAALLNAAQPNINYAYGVGQVIAMVQQAVVTCKYEATKDLFEKQNELGGDLKDGCGGGCTSGGYGEDADVPTGPTGKIGQLAKFTYVVTNTGEVELANVAVTDDNETPGDPTDDFNPAAVLSGGFNVGDLDADGRLDVGEAWLYTAVKAVTVGQHKNVGAVVGTPVDAAGQAIGPDVTDTDPAHWLGLQPCQPKPPCGWQWQHHGCGKGDHGKKGWAWSWGCQWSWKGYGDDHGRCDWGMGWGSHKDDDRCDQGKGGSHKDDGCGDRGKGWGDDKDDDNGWFDCLRDSKPGVGNAKGKGKGKGK